MGLKQQIDRDAHKVLELHAGICQALGNAKRLQILDLLRHEERSVSELTRALGIRKVNVSQHLAVLRAQGLVVARREGQTAYYRLVSPKIIRACELMREVLLAQLAERGRLAGVTAARRDLPARARAG